MNGLHAHVFAPGIGARLARVAAWSLCRAGARLHRLAAALERPRSTDEERRYARVLFATYGKLD